MPSSTRAWKTFTEPRKFITNSVAGMVEDLVRRAFLLDAALVHHDDPVGDLEGLVLVVGDEDAGDVDLLVQAPQPGAQLLAHLGVERAEGLVEQQHPRLHGQGAGERHPLALAAGELARVAVGHPVELHQLQQVVDLAVDDVARRPDAPRLHAQAEGDVLEDGHVPEQRVVLEHEADAAFLHPPSGDVLFLEADGAAAGVRPLQAGDDPQQASSCPSRWGRAAP